MNDHPNPLLELILRLLVPLLAAGDIADLERAHQAALQAIEIYTARGHNELITISQVVGFAITALDNLRLSMPPDLSLSMKLKLRTNAAALNRGSLRATATLDKPHAAPEAPATPTESPTNEPPPEPAKIEPVSATLPVAEQNRLNWANALCKATNDLQSRADQATPAQRRADRLWISALTEVATTLRAEPTPQTPQGPIANPTPGQPATKTSRLRATLMAGASVPTHLIAPAKPPAFIIS
jgi:hypothetical protein